jgi:uncharacterized protein YdeI (BOF family)
MKSICIMIAASALLSACSINPPADGNEGFDNDTYTPTGSLIPRKGPDKAAKQTVLSGDAARDAMDRIPAAIPSR